MIDVLRVKPEDFQRIQRPARNRFAMTVLREAVLIEPWNGEELCHVIDVLTHRATGNAVGPASQRRLKSLG